MLRRKRQQDYAYSKNHSNRTETLTTPIPRFGSRSKHKNNQSGRSGFDFRIGFWRDRQDKFQFLETTLTRYRAASGALRAQIKPNRTKIKIVRYRIWRFKSTKKKVFINYYNKLFERMFENILDFIEVRKNV